jgi:hypothetical protein
MVYEKVCGTVVPILCATRASRRETVALMTGLLWCSTSPVSSPIVLRTRELIIPSKVGGLGGRGRGEGNNQTSTDTKCRSVFGNGKNFAGVEIPVFDLSHWLSGHFVHRWK